MSKFIFKSFIILRLLLVIIVQTWFVPDETWQVTEVAHYWKYGYGYLTWEWQEGLRSALYPGIFTFLFQILNWLRLDYVSVLIIAPSLLSALVFAIGDYCIFCVSQILFGKNSSGWVAVALSSSWFLAYCSPRTLSSCVEMTTFALGLYAFPWHREKETAKTSYLWWIGIGFVIRPTLAILFLPYYVHHFMMCLKKIRFICHSLLIVCVTLFLSVAMDSLFYGKLTLVPWNFLHFNLIKGLSSHYGREPWYWYLTHGLPVICGTHLVPLIFGVFIRFKKYKMILLPAIWSIFIHSCLSHKEFRFILPTLPSLLCIAGDSLNSFIKYLQETDSRERNKLSIFWKISLLLLLIIPNVLLLIYMGCIHQRGPLDVIMRLRNMVSSHPSASILFLTPCHSTPLYSHLHINIPVRFLTCEPNLRELPAYVDEADQFFKSPLDWMKAEYEGKEFSIPNHVVMYDSLESELGDYLEKKHFSLCSSVFNAHFYEHRRGKYFLIYCKEND